MRYVVVGAGPAGIAAVAAMRNRDAHSPITVVDVDPHPPYSRMLLSYHIAGLDENRMYVWGRDVLERLGVDYRRGVRVVNIGSDRGVVHLSDRSMLTFDRLLIASGSSPTPSLVPGADLRGVTCLRTIAHARDIRNLAHSSSSAVVVGGGFVSLKAAEALFSLGKRVTVVVTSDQLLSQGMGREGANILQNYLERNGVRVLLYTSVRAFVGHERVERALLSDGSEIRCDLAIVGKGTIPNTEFVEGAQIAVDRGIRVDEYLRTTRSDIYAAGDVAMARDVLTHEPGVNALWPNAVEQGRIAGENMTGADVPYAGSMSMNTMRLFGVPLMSCGVTRSRPEDVRVSARFGRDTYRELIFRDGTLVGTSQVGEIINPGSIYWAIKNATAGIDVSGLLLSYPCGYDAISGSIEAL